MLTTTEAKPKVSAARPRNFYQRKVHGALEAIGERKPRKEDSISQTAIAIRLVDDLDPKLTREAVGDAFQLLADMGIASPAVGSRGRKGVTTLWTFHKDRLGRR